MKERVATFTLIGRPYTVFRAIGHLTVAGIACVYGRTLDGKFQTTARVVDVVFGSMEEEHEDDAVVRARGARCAV